MTQRNWAIIRHSGVVENITGTNSQALTYWEVLEALYREMQSAGGNADRPKTLFYNGKAVPLTNDPWSTAWNYMTEKYEAHKEATKEIQRKYLPHELKEFFDGK